MQVFGTLLKIVVRNVILDKTAIGQKGKNGDNNEY